MVMMIDDNGDGSNGDGNSDGGDDDVINKW